MRIIQVSRSTRLYPTIVLSKIQHLLIILYLLMVLNHRYCLFALQTMSSISISPQIPRKVTIPIMAWATVSFVFHMCQALSSYFSSQTEPIPQICISRKIFFFMFRETDPALMQYWFLTKVLFFQFTQQKTAIIFFYCAISETYFVSADDMTSSIYATSTQSFTITRFSASSR